MYYYEVGGDIRGAFSHNHSDARVFIFCDLLFLNYGIIFRHARGGVGHIMIPWSAFFWLFVFLGLVFSCLLGDLRPRVGTMYDSVDLFHCLQRGGFRIPSGGNLGALVPCGDLWKEEGGVEGPRREKLERRKIKAGMEVVVEVFFFSRYGREGGGYLDQRGKGEIKRKKAGLKTLEKALRGSLQKHE